MFSNMKKLIFSILASLLLTGISDNLLGQESKKELGIGDQLPDIAIDNLINYSGNLKKISDLKGKPIILDFWATWCGSCVSAFPKLDSLQKQFGKQLLILPVSYESKEITLNLLNAVKKITGINLPSIVEDTVLGKLFKYKMVPHYVWIDSSGLIKAITDAEAVTRDNIQDLITGKNMSLPVKKDEYKKYDGKPVFTNQIAENKEDVVYHSVITKFRQDYIFSMSVRDNHITCINSSIIKLYQFAFGNFNFEYLNNNRTVIEGAKTVLDSARLGITTPTTKKLRKEVRPFNAYCYELVIDSSYSRNQKLEIMQQDLNRFFAQKGLSGKIEKRKIRILSLIRTSGTDKLRSNQGKPADNYTNYSIKILNLPMSRFVSKFQAYFSQNGDIPIKDETGYKGNIDIEITCDLHNMDAVNKELEQFDLKFVEKTDELNMIVLTLNNFK